MSKYLALIPMAALFVACGGDATPEPETPEGASTPETPATPEPAEEAPAETPAEGGEAAPAEGGE